LEVPNQCAAAMRELSQRCAAETWRRGAGGTAKSAKDRSTVTPTLALSGGRPKKEREGGVAICLANPKGRKTHEAGSGGSFEEKLQVVAGMALRKNHEPKNNGGRPRVIVVPGGRHDSKEMLESGTPVRPLAWKEKSDKGEGAEKRPRKGC